ncbi:MAG: hypothetical protein ABI321_04410 [Polyangia bacterium]
MNKLSTATLVTAFAASLLGTGCANGKHGISCDPNAPNTICTIAGDGQALLAGDNGPATKASLYTPQDSVIAPNGNLWVLDFNNYLIREIDPKGTISTVVGVGFLGDSPDVGVPSCPALDAKFNHTPNMFFDADGSLYLAAWHNSRINRVELSTMTYTHFAGVGKRTKYSGDEGPAADAYLDLPSSIARAPSGDLVIMDQANQVIRSIDSAGIIHRLAGTCLTEQYDTVSTMCTMGTELYQCPGSNKATYCTDPTSPEAAQAKRDEACNWPCTPGYSGDGGPALSARMNQPFGQSADPAGRFAFNKQGELIFADTGGNRIRKIDVNGNMQTVAGSGGENAYSGDGGPATKAQLAHPIDLAIADDDTIYFTDTLNNCIRKIDPSGTISRVAGDCTTGGMCGGTGSCFSTDGTAGCVKATDVCFGGDGGDPLLARLNRPYGVELSGKKLYITDSYNQRVRVVNLP